MKLSTHPFTHLSARIMIALIFFCSMISSVSCNIMGKTGTLNNPAAVWHPGHLKLIAAEMLNEPSGLHGAFYVANNGTEMAGPQGRSSDNGHTWQPSHPSPAGFVDPDKNVLLQLRTTLDVKVNPAVKEPPEGIKHYYLKYRVSMDGGKTYLFDEPIVQQGYTKEHPFFNVWVGKNGYFLGDSGSVPIRTRNGCILVPAEAHAAGADGQLYNPGDGYSYTEAMVIVGKWTDNNRINWELKQIVRGDPAKSTRGMDEPTLAEMPDGRILMVMRGSNGGKQDPNFNLPSYKWYTVSHDSGYTWSSPEPWTYDDGSPFFSPASMSRLLMHSNGHIYWIGNISEANCRGNNPRYPLVIGEVSPYTGLLIKDTIITVDSIKASDKEGINLSHIWAYEDRESGQIIIPIYRYNGSYTKKQPVVYRIDVSI